MVLKQTLRALTPALVILACAAPHAHGKADPQMIEEWKAALSQSYAPPADAPGAVWNPLSTTGPTGPTVAPEITGPGAVLNVGRVHMKVTNFGTIGNPFTNLSNDPSGQWPGASAIEYLAFLLLSVGGVNPSATDPAALRRVSYFAEWRPASLDPEDRLYRAYDGIVGGKRLGDDDQDDRDPDDDSDKIDEDFLDGRDNDGDGKIDEDYGALGQQMYSCVIRDDTQAAINTVFNEKHVPLGLECRQLAWAYSVTGLTDFDPIEFTVINRSGHTIDSMYFGVRIDMDCGPTRNANFFVDDFDAPYIPNGEFSLPLSPPDKQLQIVIDPISQQIDTLCPRVPIRVNGFSVVDNDGDEGQTSGIASLLLLGHTTDPLGQKAPSRVGWRSFRSFVGGTPYSSNGNPTIDQERFEFISGGPDFEATGRGQNIGAEADLPFGEGFINATPGDQEGDYQAWAGIGPFLNVPDGGSIQLTIAFAVQSGDFRTTLDYPTDYQRFKEGRMTGSDLFDKHPVLANAYAAQVAYEGKYEEPQAGFRDKVPNCSGCESRERLAEGEPPRLFPEPVCEGRPEPGQKLVTSDAYTWFDYDCNYCTGVWDQVTGQGFYLRRWVAESPPPNPNLNTASSYNYTDNPERVVAAGDRSVLLAWDNLSETSPDPKTQNFDFSAYQIWKVVGWRRPVGSAGPNDEDWQLLSNLRRLDRNLWAGLEDTAKVCSTFYIPQRQENVLICLRKDEFLDQQSGMVLSPDRTVDCIRDTAGECVQDSGKVFDRFGVESWERRSRYPVGRYKFLDREVKNGFTYFYSVTASDFDGQSGRRSAVEAEGVSPQIAAGAGTSVWVVPNPYRGFRNLSERPSSWDLTPNATDPTGTHVDFFGLPSGGWTIKIYTVSGDLVADLSSNDPVNESVRTNVTGPDGVVRAGFTRQQDSDSDGQARWNLISRNGQDVVSGIYVFVVNSQRGQQRGRFVIIR